MKRGWFNRIVRHSCLLSRCWLASYWLGIFVLTHWPDIDDFPAAGWFFPHFDKIVHFCMYAGWTFAWAWVLSSRGVQIRGRVAGWLLIGGLAYGIFDELSQALVSRTPALSDLAADMAGVSAALFVLSRIRRRDGAGGL